MLSFANPLGFLALLGIPVVIAIHFLQRKSQVRTITTLFLLDQMQRESVSGNRFERLRSSVPLWLQLLMVTLLAWLLSEPRWRRADSVQRTAVVLDSSASMAVFKDATLERLGQRLAELAGTASFSDYVLLESDVTDQRLYSGSDRHALLDAAAGWDPRFGQLDPTPALRVARSLVGPEGVVVFATDHESEQPLPFNTLTLSVATPTPNVGFAGLTVRNEDGQPVWNALVRNYGDSPTTRDWWIEAGGQRSQPRSIELAPGATTAIQGPFLENLDSATVRIDPDQFTLDDALPVVRPEPKPLSVWKNPSVTSSGAFSKLLDTFDDLAQADTPETADITATAYSPLDPVLPDGHGIVFVSDPRKDASYSAKPLVAANHTLTRDLNWQGLLARETLRIPAYQTDEVLLWQGDLPLIFLRPSGDHQLLCFNFDPDKSNATKLPAFVVMAHRFLNGVRRDKIASESINVECGQDLDFAFDVSADAPPLTLRRPATADTTPTTETFPLMQASRIDAPATPGFFEVHQGDQRLLRGAAHFADAREADFNLVTARDDLDGLAANLVEQHTERDSLWRLWLLVLIAAALTSWHFTKPTTTPTPTTTHP